MSDTNSKLSQIIADLLDIDEKMITPETFLVRELGVESIDMLEMAVSINAAFSIDVNDSVLFLRNLRQFLHDADESKLDRAVCLSQKYPHLGKARVTEILGELNEGPVVKVRDLSAYIDWQKKNCD